MSIGEPIFLLSGLWCIIHALHYLWSRNGASVLPTLNNGINRQRSGTKLSLNNLQLKILTTNCNTYHDYLSNILARRRNKKLNILVQSFYNLGSILGAVGMSAAIGGLLWIFAASIWTLFHRISANDFESSNSSRLVKRWLESPPVTRQSAPSPFPSITPIIPGVTVPLSDLPFIIFAVFVCQIVHELGHAIAAAHESLPMISAGLSFTIFVPAAFVAFPISGMKNLGAKARARVIAAGPFHNLVFWCFLVLVTRLQLVNMVSHLAGYKNVSSSGRAVIGVNADSPLALHIRPGSIITRLDDLSLGGPFSTSDRWSDFLTGKIEKSTQGWCVMKSDFVKSDACCSFTDQKQTPFMCFATQDRQERGCIDPVPIMTKPTGFGRCTSAAECSSGSICALPHAQSQLTRLSVLSSELEPGTERIILWNGPPKEIWQEVQVSNWLPRFRFLPLRLPPVLEAIWDYLTMATLSLYIFNLLPLPQLDGSELLCALIDMMFDKERTAFSFDVEALEGGEYHEEDIRTRRRWKERVMKHVPRSMSCIVAWCILFWTVNAVY